MLFFKKKTVSLNAFANGEIIDITKVPDTVFSDKLMGDGIAIIPDEGVIVAPCDAKVKMVMDNSFHAVGLLLDDGSEILIHIGLETVNLQGDGLTPHVQVGDSIKTGDVLITYDKKYLNSKGINDITMMVILNNTSLSKKILDQHVNTNASIIEMNPLKK